MYGSLIHNGETNVKVEVIGDQMSSTYNISNENRLILQTVPILRLPNALNVTVRGVGCALVQVTISNRKNLLGISQIEFTFLKIVCLYIYLSCWLIFQRV